SWLFEVILFKLHDLFGLAGIVYYNVVLTIAVTTAIFALVRCFEHRFIVAVALSAATIVAILPVLLTPRPWLFSILFFSIELHILLNARRTEDTLALWYLPPLFALWANLHIQFVYGLLLLGMASIEFLVRAILRRFMDAVDDTTANPVRMMLLTLTCAVATLANPYHYKVYLPVFDFAGQRGFYDLISELQSPQFRTLAEWLALGLVVGAAYVLGKRRKIDVFFALVLLTAITISFRSKRDIWLVAIASTGVMAASYSELAIISRLVLRKAHILGLAM